MWNWLLKLLGIRVDTHDLRDGGWCIEKLADRGKRLIIRGWCKNVARGDYIIIGKGKGSRYIINEISYRTGGWRAEVLFAPRVWRC